MSLSPRIGHKLCLRTVSYTHLTLPTIYSVDFIVLETQLVFNLRAQTLVILGHPFLAANAIMNYRNGSMRLTFGDMTREVHVFNSNPVMLRIKHLKSTSLRT